MVARGQSVFRGRRFNPTTRRPVSTATASPELKKAQEQFPEFVAREGETAQEAQARVRAAQETVTPEQIRARDIQAAQRTQQIEASRRQVLREEQQRGFSMAGGERITRRQPTQIPPRQTPFLKLGETATAPRTATTFDVLRRDVISRTPDGQVSIAGTASRGIRFTSEALAEATFQLIPPLRDTALGQPVPPIIREIGNIPTSPATLTFIGFAPALSTTAQIETALATPTRIGFVGQSRQVQGTRNIVTDVVFKFERGRVSEAGVSRIISAPVGTGTQGRQTFISAARGTTFRRGVTFPTGRETLRTTSRFESADLSVTTPFGERGFFQIAGSRGRVLPRGEIGTSGTVAAGIRGRDVSLVAGVSQPSQTGFVGAIRNIRTPGTFGFEAGSGVSTQLTPGRFVPPVQRAITQSLQQRFAPSPVAFRPIVPQGTSITPPPFPSTTPEIITRPQITPLSTPISPSVTQRTSPIQTVIPGQRTGGVPRVRVTTFQATQLRTQQIQRESPRQTERISQIPRELQRTQQRQGTLQLQRQIQVQRFRTPVFTPSFRFQPRERTPFRIPTQPRQPSFRERLGIPVLVRRGGSFRFVGAGRTIGEAVGIGSQVVSTTLARTFTLPGISPSQVRGFRARRGREGTLFIEPSRRALGTGTEIREIQTARQRRGRR